MFVTAKDKDEALELWTEWLREHYTNVDRDMIDDLSPIVHDVPAKAETATVHGSIA
jgi:hypothetical protein